MKPELPPSVHEHVVEQLLTRDWSNLEVLEHVDYLLFPDCLYRRRADGTFESKAIMLRVPRQHELRAARVEARAIAAKEGINSADDALLFENLENLVLLSKSIRNNTHPFEPYEPDPLVLERRYDTACLMQLWGKLDKLNRVLDPAPATVTEPEVIALMAAIAKAGNIGPLAVYGQAAQASCIVIMASLLTISLASKSSSEPSGQSTQE